MKYVIDMQCFKKPINSLVIKELVIGTVDENDDQPMVFLFEPPTRWHFLPQTYKKQNAWILRNFHGIPWQSGLLSYNDMDEILTNIAKTASLIYVKGHEKQIWLEKYFKNHLFRGQENIPPPSCLAFIAIS